MPQGDWRAATDRIEELASLGKLLRVMSSVFVEGKISQNLPGKFPGNCSKNGEWAKKTFFPLSFTFSPAKLKLERRFPQNLVEGWGMGKRIS